MASRTSPSWLLSAFVLLSVLSSQVRALHLYMEGNQQKCFFEELPKDTLVVGTNNPYKQSLQSETYDTNDLQEPTKPSPSTETPTHGSKIPRCRSGSPSSRPLTTTTAWSRKRARAMAASHSPRPTRANTRSVLRRNRRTAAGCLVTRW